MSSLPREQQAPHSGNATRTVCRLPPDVILAIFAQSCTDKRSIYVSTGWVKLRLVSRYWNAVACATPVLWREIDVYRDPSWLTLCLERSQGATLDVALLDSEFPAEAVVRLIFPHAHRLRTLRVDVGIYSPGLSSIVIPQLRVLNMHVLEHLQVTARELEADQTSNDLNLTHSRHPLLHTLNLHRGALSDMQLISNLRVLDISSSSSDLSINQFIAALASSWRLEKLLLHTFLEHLTGWASLSEICQRPATLSCLTTLDVSEYSPAISAAFLTHLRLPASARISIGGVLDPTADEATHSLCSLLPPAPILHEALPVLRGSIRRVTANMWFSHYDVFAFTSASDLQAPDRLSFSLSFDVTRWENRLSRGLSDLRDVFRGSPLTYLQLAGPHTHVDQEHWVGLFTSFPDLDTITLHGEGSIVPFWTALASGLDERHPGDPDAPSPLCPRLKHVVYAGYHDDVDALFAAMLNCLVERAKWGLSLRSLRGLRRQGATTEYKEMADVYASKLRDIVGMVDFSNTRIS
ncbi:hypothetical protein C2E23DRAFT_863099 [Lenzites betulinus]|nr:hypothetical protein C2E23DRAFT_863099 [Lenzites betulinus]